MTGRHSKLVMISINGLRPDFFLNPDFDAPVLKALVHAGKWCSSVTPVYPSVTFPNHTTLVTGVRPAKHGIVSNTIFSWERNVHKEWYWHSRFVRVPTLWSEAKRAGLKVASIRWPVTVGAEVDWLVPEIFSDAGFDHEESWKLTLEHTSPRLTEEFLNQAGAPAIGSYESHDRYVSEVASYILGQYHPDLLLAHLINADHVQHTSGLGGPEVMEAVKGIDRAVGEILRDIDLDRDCVMIVGDHGFIPFHTYLNLNFWFLREGWISERDGQIVDWRVFAHLNCGQAAIYVRDRSLSSEVMDFLGREGEGRLDIVDRTELDRLEAFPEALCAVEPRQGYSAGDQLISEPSFRPLGTHGQHGYLPDRPGMETGLILAGPGIKAGKGWEKLNLVDIAPIAAGILGISLG